MKPSQLENWTIEILDRVKRKEPIEDSRVELKREWIDYKKAARRIAGHANAARGAEILWIIGVDEKDGVVGAEQYEFALWFSQIKSQFDGLAPSVQDLIVPYAGKTVVALLFETNRAPFVVSNPVYGQKDGGSVSLEVPWRELTGIRSAKRDDLIRLLVPLLEVPTIEVLDGEFRMERSDFDTNFNNINLNMYVVPNTQDMVVIPFHKLSVNLRFDEISDPYVSDDISLYADGNSSTLKATYSELVVQGPGKFWLNCGFSLDIQIPPSLLIAYAKFIIGFAGSDNQVIISCQFEKWGKDYLELAKNEVTVTS